MHESCTLDISQRQYFDTFWGPNGSYGVKEHGAVQGYKNMVLSPWKQGKMTLEAVVPVKGVPFCDETRCFKTFTIKQKNEKQTVIEMEAHTPDVPYGQTFCVRESWLTAQSPDKPDQILFSRLMKIEFVKYTIFQSKINKAGYAGIKENAAVWLEQAKERDCFTARDYPPQESIAAISDEESRPLLAAGGPGEHDLRSLNISSINAAGQTFESGRRRPDYNDTTL